MDRLRKIAAVLTLAAVLLAFVAPALAQMQGMPAASPTMMPGRAQNGMQDRTQGMAQDRMQGGMSMPVEQSGKDMMGALTDTKDTSMAASVMRTSGLESATAPGEQYTLFVASDGALKATSPDVVNRMMEGIKDRQVAMDFVKGHMISGIVMPDQMTDGKTLTMMNGKTMTARTTDGRIMVDDANIIKAIRTGNGVVYVMDRIPSSIMTMIDRMGTTPASAGPASGCTGDYRESRESADDRALVR